ncbi:Cro/Cl family transcriptional regulator, partial [Salmonella enterica]|nr:Cro/Cl family transcriptional regulator [Salmonella enterica]
QLTFNWQGVVPAAPVNSDAWAFVDGLDIPYTPGTEQLNILVDPATKDASIASVKPYDFFIVPVTGPVTPGVAVTRGAGPMNNMKAFLATNPISGGFVSNKQLAPAAGPQAVNGEVAVTLNGQIMKVGSTNAVTITPTAATEAHVLVDINAKAASADVQEGASVSFTAPVIFSVDI